MAADPTPESMLDVFRTAALSVTKLYKSSIDAQKAARAEGYRDCLDELQQYLDRENLGLNDGEGWLIRAWANERYDNRDASTPADVMESDDDSERQDAVSSPEVNRSTCDQSPARAPEPEAQPQTYRQPTAQEPVVQCPRAPDEEDIVVDEADIVVPSRDTFDFRAPLPYPQDTQNPLNLAGLRLSESNRPHDHTASHPSSTPSLRKPARRGRPGRPNRGPRTGTKRPMDFNEFFDVELTNFKDCGPPSKRRHL